VNNIFQIADKILYLADNIVFGQMSVSAHSNGLSAEIIVLSADNNVL
jgi:hypothetical protein